MASHDAHGQLTGYLYQIRYALLLLLENENPNYRISIEKFDDISFENDGSPIELIQTKHHLTNTGNLSDGSMDLWRTIKAWLDEVECHPELLGACRFLIITTASAPENSAASYLMKKDRNIKEAIRLLTESAKEEGAPKQKKACFEKFLSTKMETLTDLFESVEIITNTPQILNVESKIRNRVRVACFRENEDKVIEQLEGWWFRSAIKALSSPNQTLMNGVDLQNKIASIAYQFRPDNLPIERWKIDDELSDGALDADHRVFLDQLRLLDSDAPILRRAIKNYYSAYWQRSSWSRDQLLRPDELTEYEERLVDEWEQQKAFINAGNDVENGRELYKRMMDMNIPIRPLCLEPYVSRGSYEMLSDKLEIGWHADYLNRLKTVREEE